MDLMDLWRAARDDYLDTPCAFAARREDAEAYTRNRGFGGPRLFRARVEAPAPESVLDLVGMSRAEALDALVEATGMGHPGAIGPEEWVMHQRVAQALLERGYVWVRLVDSYPEGCETWILISDDEDEVSDAMEEVTMEEVR